MGEALVCKLYKKVAFSQTGPKEAIFTRLRCKQWSCEFCAKKNASIWRAFLKEKLPTISKEWYLVTFTANRHTRTKQGSLANLRDNLDKLFKRIKRCFGSISYVRTFERHPTSLAIHAHFIISGLAPFVAIGASVKHRPMSFGVLTRRQRNGVWGIKTWLKINAQECKIGMICDARLIEGDPVYAVLYVCKYLTKSQQELDVKGLRHVQTTRDVGSPKSVGEVVWQTANYITARMFPPNTSINDINTGQVINNDFWEHTGFYPNED